MHILKNTKFILILIIVVASCFRLWQLGSIPPSPDWDEAAYGYNAYSVIKTGQDEFGAFLPVVLRSFDDYKPALYLYLVIPFVSVLGITTEAVRLPSALVGILTVLLTFHLVKLLCKRNDLALLTAFLLAISPWHIQFSRIAFEANVGVLLNMSMVYFFVKSLKHPRFLSLATLCGGLSIYAYQSEKVFTPLLALVLLIVYFKDVKKLPLRQIILAGCLGLLVILPMGNYLLTNNQALTRAKATSIFSDTEILKKSVSRLATDNKNNDLLGKVLDNRRIFYAVKIVEGYIVHFTPNWLFIEGDNPRHHAPNMGLLYLFELPFLLIGFYCFLFLPIDKRAKIVLLLWFFLAPVPASITSGVPHAVRTLNFLPIFQLFTATGIIASYLWLRKQLLYYSFILILCIAILCVMGNILYYINQYFVQMNIYYSKDWQYGYEKIVPIVSSISGKYDKIVVSNKEPMDQSYIFFLYYLRYDPATYHKESMLNNSGGFAEKHTFGKYEFRPIEWDKEKKERVLFIGRPSDFPGKIRTLKKEKYLDGTDAIKIVGLDDK